MVRESRCDARSDGTNIRHGLNLILTQTGGPPEVAPTFHPMAHEFRDIVERERKLGLPPGMPVLVSPTKLDDRLNVYFRHEFAPSQTSTMMTYAKELRLWLKFLESRDVEWDEARRDDERAFQTWRVYDTSNLGRVTPATWNKGWSALKHFYAWARREKLVDVDPISERGTLRNPVGIGGHREKNARASRDRWVTPAEYAMWRDVGLRGYEAVMLEGKVTAGLQKEVFPGRNLARNAAFTDFVLSSGLREEEAGKLLEMEIPAAVGDKAPVLGKGNVFRHYEILNRMGLASLRAYVEGERRDIIRRAQRNHRYENLKLAIQIREVLPGGRLGQRVRLSDGRIEDVSMLPSRDRRRLLIEGSGGWEPAALWLTESGTPMPHTTWNAVFNAANPRVSAARHELGIRSPWVHVTPHSLRFTFALMVLVAGIRATDEALGFGPADPFLLSNYLHVFEEVRDLLGHSSVGVTVRNYLEPVKGLRRSSIFRRTSLEEVWDEITAASPLVGFGGQQ